MCVCLCVCVCVSVCVCELNCLVLRTTSFFCLFLSNSEVYSQDKRNDRLHRDDCGVQRSGPGTAGTGSQGRMQGQVVLASWPTGTS